VSDAHGETKIGSGEPLVNVAVNNDRAYEEVLRSGSVGLGRSYVKGWWECDDLTMLLRILFRSLAPTTSLLDKYSKAREQVASLVPASRRPADPERDRRNIRAHYDLSNEFFELMLDETMAYSCAIFEHDDWTLADASRAKLDRLCRRLRLSSDDHVLEIGTGWGSFAVHAATHYGCRVTTTTISDAQFDYVTKRVANAGLSDIVTVLNCDYRELSGRFDKLVSIEMIEAIGWRQFATYFSKCASLVSSNGLMAIQAIVIEDGSFARSKHHDDFINQMVFPGGCLPSVAAMTHAANQSGELRMVSLEDIGDHYPETLRRWHQNLTENAHVVASLGFDGEVTRLWSMYLAYCEAGFLERHISDVQMVFAVSRNG